MAASVGPQPGRIWSPQPRRGVGAVTPPATWRPRRAQPWEGEEVRLARDLSALIEAGLIVAVGDGPEIRYAVAESDEEGR